MLFKSIIKVIVGLCLSLTIVLLFLFISLPAIIESQMENRLPEFLNSNDVAFDIQKLGFHNTLISKIRISRGISIDSINIDYDIKKLSSIHVDKVTVSGLSIHAALDENNQIGIQGLKFPKSLKDQPGQRDLSFLSFLPEKLVLQNAKIILHALDDEFLIPFDVLSTTRSKDGKITARAMVYPFGEKIKAFVTYDINKGIEFLKIEGKSFDSGHIDQFISQKTKTNGLQLKGPVDFILETSSPQKKWKINISQVKFTQPVKIAFKDVIATLLIDSQKVSARGIPLKRKGKITLGLKQGSIQYNKETVFFTDTKIVSDIVLDFTDNGKGLSSKFKLTANNISIKSDLMDSWFPFAGVSGRFLFDKNRRPSIGMTLKASKGKIISSRFKTRAYGINIEIPIHYPDPANKLYGKYSVLAVSYNNQYKFSTNGKILQTDSKEFKVSGKITLKTLPGLKGQFKSMIGFKKGVRASLDFKTNPVKLNDADMVKLIGRSAQDADIDVTVSAKGKAKFSNHQLKTFMRINVIDGNISIPDMNLTATGINTTADFNNLLAPETVPGQILTIDSIKMNKIKINDARIRYSIEDAGSLLVENIKFKWCNGLVSTESIRIPRADNTYSLNLYCDRLELAQLLKQMGAFHAEGKGTLNGRIPIIYSDGNISFENGFLFSTPGSGGKVVIKNTDMITAGISKDNPQFSQLDLATEALKDFDYKWAKLVFHTFEDTLYMNMELDGKPARLLPFEYQKEFGGFIRVDASSPGSHFQGIKLDVNLKLPFNEVMKFGNKLKSIFN